MSCLYVVLICRPSCLYVVLVCKVDEVVLGLVSEISFPTNVHNDTHMILFGGLVGNTLSSRFPEPKP